MAKASMHVAYYLFLLTFCIDEGDGRWKKTEREILQRDIKLYKKIAERVEHELKEYYDEYSEEEQRFDAERKKYQLHKKFPNSSTKEDSSNEEFKNENLQLLQESIFTNNIPTNDANNIEIVNDSESLNKTKSRNAAEQITSARENWPKFEDMLLEIGKKYDWKNDRWIKVKEKFKNKQKDFRKFNNSIMFHEKHRFSYRSIKLNRGYGNDTANIIERSYCRWKGLNNINCATPDPLIDVNVAIFQV